MDPEFAAALAHRSASTVSLDESSVAGKSPVQVIREQARPFLKEYTQHHAELLPPESTYTVEDRLIPVENGEIRVRCVVPAAEDEATTFPVLVWFHGGVWIVGDVESDDNQLRRLCVDVQISVVNVEYRLAPEHLFPVGLNDAYAAVKWTVENALSLRVHLSKGLILGGDSAGANLATVCAHLARDDPSFDGSVTGQLIREPAIVHPDAYPEIYRAELRSMEEFKDGPILTRDTMMQGQALLNAPPSDPRFSPLLFPSHVGVAPAFITYNELDPLKHEGRLWERVLSEAGVRTKAVCYPGVPHGFYNVCPKISLARKAERDLEEGLKWLLSGSP